MSEAPAAGAEAAAATPGDQYKDSPIIHRICEACNNMFTVHAADPDHRCKACHK